MSRKYGQNTHGQPAVSEGPPVYGRGGWEVRPEGMPSMPTSGSFRRRTDASRSETYTPRRTSRFDQQGVLSSLVSAPPLPSPAITPRVDASVMNSSALGAHKLSPLLGPQAVSMTPRHAMQGLALNQAYSPEGGGVGMERSTWLPSPRASMAGSFRFAGPEMSVDGSFISKQVLETQDSEFISKLENSLIHMRPGEPRQSLYPAAPERSPILEDQEQPSTDLEAELARVESLRPDAMQLPPMQDMEADEVWETLVMWCTTHGSSIDPAHLERLGHGLDVWRVEQFTPVYLNDGHMGRFSEGDVYLILNRVDDAQSAVGNVDEAYHLRRSRVRTLWTMHFWIGARAHPLKAGVAAILAVDLCHVLKRHARPIREVQGEEGEMFRSLFPRGIHYDGGDCPHGFREAEPEGHTPRLVCVEAREEDGARAVSSRAVDMSAASLHEEGCFVLDLETTMFTFFGASASARVKAHALQLASCLRFRTPRRGERRRGCRQVMVGYDEEEDEVFWATLRGRREAVAKRRAGGEGEWSHVLYRVDDLQDELEVTEVQSGGRLHSSVLEPSLCLVLDCGREVYVWKGRHATLDARMTGEGLGRDLAAQREGATVILVPQDTDDVLFRAKFADTHWVVYTTALPPRISTQPVQTRQISVRKMHSVTVRSWLETGQVVRQHNRSAAFVQNGVLSSLKAWSVENFSLSPVTEASVGHFVMDRSYLVQCTYRCEGLDRHIIYFWQGWVCSRVESLVWQYDVSALMAKQIETQTGCKPLQVRVQQGKEPGHFLDLFNGGVIIHASSLPGAPPEEQRCNSAVASERLYSVAGTCPGRAYSVQVEAKAGSLNSNTCFLLFTRNTLFLWLGHWTDVQQRDVALHVARAHQDALRLVTVHERQEPAEFWSGLGCAGGHVCPGFRRETGWWEPRLFACKAVSCQLRVRELFDFVQADLRAHKAMILDDYEEVFVWVGPQCNAVVQRMALSLALDYIKMAPDGRNRQVAPVVVQAGAEPPAFRAHFPWWLAWPAGPGEEAERLLAQKKPPKMSVRHIGISPAVLRQAVHMLNKVTTRERNALDLIVWKNHERAKWMKWSSGVSPFQNTFYQRVGPGRTAQ